MKSNDNINKRWMIVTQRVVGEDTKIIKELAPKTWNYLESYADKLDNRASRIYKGQPRFAIFGVGDYTFAPWKIVISGFKVWLDDENNFLHQVLIERGKVRLAQVNYPVDIYRVFPGNVDGFEF